MSERFGCSVNAQKQMEFTRADVFDWLALTEAISYEDFNFITIANELISIPDVEELSSPCEQVFSLPYTGKRLLVVPSLLSSNLSSAQVGDITCIRLGCYGGKCSCQSEIEEIVDTLSKSSCCSVCLSWHCSSKNMSDIIRQNFALQYIEWAWQGGRENETVYAGLVLSPCWRSGVSKHIAKVIANYNATLPPCPWGEARLAVTYQ